MTYAQLAGQRERILREIEQARRESAHALGRLRRLQDDLAAIDHQIAGRCIPRLTEVVNLRAAEFLRS
jgi:hypothetical protein